MNAAASASSKVEFRHHLNAKAWLLIIAGAVMVVLFLASGITNWVYGSKTTTVATPTAASGSAIGTSPTPASATTTTTTTTKGEPSENVLTALLAAGAVLILVGALYRRITSIKLPGGSEIDLTPSERKQVQDKVKSNVEAEVKASVGDDAKAAEYIGSVPNLVAGITDVVAADLSKTKASKGVSELDVSDIDAAVSSLVPKMTTLLTAPPPS